MDLSKHLDTAADAVKRRNYAFAVKLYGQILGLQPDSGEARSGLRQALFKKAEQKPPSKLFALLGGGIHLLVAVLSRLLRQHPAAARAYERYLSLDPLAEGANLKLGDSLELAGCQNSALAVFSAYAEAQPRCLEACRRAGALYYAAGKWEDALRMYEMALRVDPRDQESLKARKNLAAEGALRSTGIEDASSSRQVIKDMDTHRKLEKADRLQLSKEEISDEIAELEEELGERPKDQKLLLRMANLLEMDGDLTGALDTLDRAVFEDPQNSELRNRAGRLRLDLQEKKVEEAEARGDAGAAEFARKALEEARVVEYRRQVEHTPTDLKLRFQLGRILFQTAAMDEAIAELQQAVKDPTHKGEGLLLLGEAFAAKGLNELALGQLQKALEVTSEAEPRSKEILYAMGKVAQDMGQREQALARFSRILEQDIGYRDVAKKVDELKVSPSS